MLTIDYVLQIANYSFQCAALPMHTTTCAKFWGMSFFAAAALMFVVFILIARHLVIERLEFNAYLKKKADRAKIADPDVMEASIWKGGF